MHDMMYRCLKAYCVFDPEIGYTQGMNYMISSILFHLIEAQLEALERSNPQDETSLMKVDPDPSNPMAEQSDPESGVRPKLDTAEIEETGFWLLV